MIVSTEHKFIFISNPKCASSSIRRSLHKYHNHTIEEHLKKMGDWHDHLIAQEVYNRIGIFCNVKKYFIFTTIRNPWERVVSFYNYAARDKRGLPWFEENYDKNTAGEFPFVDYMNMLEHGFSVTKPDEELKNRWNYVAFPDINTVINHKDCNVVDKVYRSEDNFYEQIKTDFKKRNINVHLRKFFLSTNEKNHRMNGKIKNNKTLSFDYRKYYTRDKDIELVADRFKSDVEMGGYVF